MSYLFSADAAIDISNVDPELMELLEASVLGACVADPTIAQRIGGIVEDSDFTSVSHRVVYGIIQKKLNLGKVDEISFVNIEIECSRNNIHLDTELLIAHSGTEVEEVERRARIIRETALLKQLRNDVNSMTVAPTDGLEDVLDRYRNIITRVSNRYASVTPALSLEELHGDLMAYLDSDEEPVTFKLGIPVLDSDIYDLMPGNTAIIAALPGVGKTSLGIFTALHNAMRGIPVHIYSLEMSKLQITARCLSTLTQIPATRMIRKTVTTAERERIRNALEKFEALPLRITAHPDMPLPALLQGIRDSRLRYGTDLFFIDYIQLVTYDEAPSKREEIGKITQKLKSVALETESCIIQMSQLSRRETGKEFYEPTMRDLKESSDLEQAASLILMLYPVPGSFYKPGTSATAQGVFAKVEKQRNGPTYKRVVEFDAEAMRWRGTNLDYEAVLEEYRKSKKDNS